MKMATCQSGGADPYQYKLRWGFSPYCSHGSYAYVCVDRYIINLNTHMVRYSLV